MSLNFSAQTEIVLSCCALSFQENAFINTPQKDRSSVNKYVYITINEWSVSLILDSIIVTQHQHIT